ncbi:Flp pilus assembly protein CpaB [Ferrimonas sp. SCSIO 43195]|uniref:Flp pilus assembly protein CpaB n=1 Tax=Ferrimonas sp. SCSIO 43195 TaxID=2822844 RepID=UPI0020752A04|nr:Flp pilus assembly protein CpaB [Ferrimonas sp. SCSIO 43195]USD38810.1 Flp pilus assembly protein CpaB [Ferrimonas sp. SCSIO 43195]
MSSKVTFAIAFLAVVFGLYGILDRIGGNDAPATPPEPVIKMITLWQATVPLVAGQHLNQGDLKRLSLPEADARQLGVDGDVTLTLTPSTLVSTARHANDWVFPEHLSQPDNPGYLDLLTSDGMTLYPLSISAKNLIDNYIRPGDYIDILAVGSPHTNLSNATVELTNFNGVHAGLLLQRVKVLALDNQSDAPINPRVDSAGALEAIVVIEVAPESLAKLSLAQRTMFIEIYRSQQQHPIPDADVSDVIVNYTGVKELRGSQSQTSLPEIF